jgi:outer membrane protein OmpA-like peptidoglycan-associated protein
VNSDGTYEDGAPMGSSFKNEYTCSNLEPNTTYNWKQVGIDADGRYIPPGIGGSFTTGDGSAPASTAPKNNVQWSRFDFVPGDEVLFEDGPEITEENGEFPSRWDLKEGNAEIMQVNDENVICFPQGGEIVPYIKNSKSDYLPDVFTVEFDAFFIQGYARRYYLYFSDRKNQSSNGNGYATIYVNSISFGESEGTYPGAEGSNHSINGGWRHISIASTQGKLKMYMDDTRLINIPRYSANPSGITIECEGYAGDKPEELQYIKNVRIAKGGVKYYDRVMTDGKIICNGIKFDVNKATLKPESMGPINEIYSLLQKQPDLKFSVEGHTDNDGDADKNQALSEQRAKTVMEQLISMGISVDRLTSSGFGESMPLDNNSSPEGKANNRRVEFVKI